MFRHYLLSYAPPVALQRRSEAYLEAPRKCDDFSGLTAPLHVYEVPLRRRETLHSVPAPQTNLLGSVPHAVLRLRHRLAHASGSYSVSSCSFFFAVPCCLELLLLRCGETFIFLILMINVTAHPPRIPKRLWSSARRIPPPQHHRCF